MAKSLDELIEYLLDEIAVCGSGGVSISQVTEVVKSFYRSDRIADQAGSPSTSQPDNASPLQTVDDAFIARVWRWLGRHPEVSIGKHGKFNDTPLHQFQTRADAVQDRRNRVPRIFVSEELTYRSICGHAPDRSRVFPSEYALLSQIAAARAEGVLQGNLGRLTGQDKRSVPKRTDALEAKGYIVKQPTYVNGVKTSLLILCRYVKSTQKSSGDSDLFDASASLNASNGGELLVRHVVQKLSSLLLDGSLVELEQLHVLLEDKSEVAKKVLSKIIRPLERAGCFKRVKTAFGPAAHSGDLKIHVQHIRVPSPEDLLSLEKASISLDRPILEWLNEEKAKLSPQIRPEDSRKPQAAQNLVQWNPDRTLANTLRQAVSQSGAAGIALAHGRDAVTRPFMQNTLESLLARFSHHAPLSQPDGLHHLAIVRSTKAYGDALEHVHHSPNNFIEGGKTGLIDASSVPGADLLLQNSLALRSESTTIHDSLVADRPRALLGDGSAVGSRVDFASLAHLIRSVNATDVLPASGEPRIARNDNGIEEVKRLAREESPEEEEQPDVRSTRPKQGKMTKRRGSDERPRGRPRKFVRGTEKFWQLQFWQARLALADDEGPPPTKEGIMSDPAGLDLFESRPDNFDETLVDAKAAGLPVPATPDEITDDWVRQTQAVLERSDDGAYTTPVGMYLGRIKARSQLLIARSSRLRSVDWHDRTKVPKFRFISSSVAHSFQCRRYYPQMAKPPRRAPRAPKKSRVTTREGDEQNTKAVRKAASGSGPQLGVFLEVATIAPGILTNQSTTHPPPRRLSDSHRYMDTTESDTDWDGALGPSDRKARSKPIARRSLTNHMSVPPLVRRHSTISTASRSQGTARNSPLHPLHSETEDKEAGQDSVGPLGAGSDEQANNTASVWKSTDEQKRGIPDTAQVAEVLEVSVPLHRSQDVHLVASEGAEGHHRSTSLHDSNLTPRSVVTSGNEAPDGIATAPDGILEKAPLTDVAVPAEIQGPPGETSGRRSSLPIVSHDGAYDPQSDIEDQESVHTDARSITGEPHLETQARKRSLSSADSDVFEPESPVKRQKRAGDGSGALCQRVVLELVELAHGSAPNNRTTLQRHMVNRWQAGGGKDRPLMKPIKAAVNSLVSSGKLKEHIFTFRGKGGVMIRRSILHVPSIDAASAQIHELKKIIVDADATEYVPQEWSGETLPPRKATISRRRPTVDGERPSIQPLSTSKEPSQLDDISLVNEEVTPAQVSTNTRPKRTPKPRKTRDEILSSTQEARTLSEPSAATGFLTLKLRATSPEPSPTPASGILTLKLRTPTPEPTLSPGVGFLTLKVRGLRDLHQVQDFNSSLSKPPWKAVLLPVPLKFNTEASSSTATALPTPVGQRKSGLRRESRHTRYDENTRKIIWAPPEQVIPKDLEHLLRLEAIKGNVISDSEADDPIATTFGTIDIVAAWEERDSAFILSKDAGWTFINHESSLDLLNSSNVRAWYLVDFDNDLQELQRECAEFPSWEPFVAAQLTKAARKKKLVKGRKPSQNRVASADPERRVTRQATGAVKKRKWTSLGDDAEASPQSKRAKRPSVAARPESTQSSDRAGEAPLPAISRRPPKKAIQTKPSKPLPLLAGADLEFATNVICISTLVGGIEKVIDWKYVSKLLPGQAEEALKRRWKTISQAYSYEIDQLSERFQDTYVNAFEQGEAPPIDFVDLDGTDWEGIVAWAGSHLDVTKLHEGKGRLAASRDQQLENDNIQIEEVRGLKDMYGNSIGVTNTAKEEIYSTIIGGTTILQPSYQDGVEHANRCEMELRNPTFAAARSRVLATILTSEIAFDPEATEEKLTTLANTAAESEVIVKSVVNALHRDRLITRRPADLIEWTGLRQWQSSDSFNELFVSRRVVHALMLKRAAAYKMTTLDATFSRGEKVVIAKDAIMDDGVMVSVLNLVSQGQIQLRPGADVPNSRYGIDWMNVGYQTKLIDKSKIAFSTVLQPTGAYTFGDPLLSDRNITVPRGGVDQANRRIPLWIDINCSLQTERWETVVAAVLGLLSIRPGVDARELAHVFDWALTPWEIDLILDWSKDSGLARQTPSGKGWHTLEWWWMAVGNDIAWS